MRKRSKSKRGMRRMRMRTTGGATTSRSTEFASEHGSLTIFGPEYLGGTQQLLSECKRMLV